MMTNKTEHPTITQADRDAAADLIEAYWSGADEGMMKLAKSYRAGHSHGAFVRAFAKHRTTSLAAQDGLAPLIVAGMNLRQYWEDVGAYKEMSATVMIMKSGEMRKRDAETKRDFLDALKAALSAIKGDKS